jgi:hypothetical protein
VFKPISLRREFPLTGDAEFGVSSRAGVRSATEIFDWLSPLGIIAALLAISAPIYFARGIGIFDDSLYLKAGQLILDGLKPYRDFYDNKPPGIYYVSAMIAAVGGRGWLAPRIFLFLFAAAFQVALIRWLQRRFDARVATIAAVLIGLSYPMCQGYSLHTEPFGAAAAFAACALLLSDAPSLRRWAAAGALLGLATAFKQTGVLYLAAIALFALFDVRRQRGGINTLVATLASLVGGFLAALAPIALAFAAQGLAGNVRRRFHRRREPCVRRPRTTASNHCHVAVLPGIRGVSRRGVPARRLATRTERDG